MAAQSTKKIDRDIENLEFRVESLEEQQQAILGKLETYKSAEERFDGGMTALKWVGGFLTFLATIGHCLPIDY